MKVKFVSQSFLTNGSGFYPSKTVFYKIKKSIFRTNYARCEKIWTIKIVHLKKIYKFGFDHFLVKSTVFVLIEKTLLKLKNCGCRPNNTRYEKMLRSKILYLKKIYKFGFDHFLVKSTVFLLIEKTLLKLKNCGCRPNNTRYEKILTSKILYLKKIYKFDFHHFLIKRTVFVLIWKMLLKIKNSIFRTNSATYETNVEEQNCSF